MNIENYQIDLALPKIKVGLDKYYEIQNLFENVDVKNDKIFQKKFNGFYKVRRNTQWRGIFFELMDNQKFNKNIKFDEIFLEIYKKTNRVEASFSSKLVATINTNLPVLDSFVLENLELKLPAYYDRNRLDKTIDIYNKLKQRMENLQNSNEGQYMILKFKEMYPNYKISNIKMIDLILWQIR